jgi:glycosyltransferase involved in cell wall biosynthesis
MPRKRAADVMLIREIFRRRFGHEHGDVAWVAIDGAGEAEVARILGESEVFLSMNHLEGLGMPPLEAMAAGCQVAGFTGGGGDDYATPENGFWIAENDHLGCAFALAEALDRAGRGDPRRAAMLAAGRATAERYDLPRMRDALRAFWGDALERRASELARL